MDAALRLALESYSEAAAAAKTDGGAALAARRLLLGELPYALLQSESGGEPEAELFVRLDRAESASELTARGATVLLQRGDLALVRMPVSGIADAAGSPRVESMVISKHWSALLDSSRIRSKVKDVHNNTGATLPQAYDGTNVTVGVLDTGLDYTHQDFRATDSDSRLLGLFDFSAGANGAECRPGQLDSLTCGEIDGSGGFGHGTHVTGIAAGNGRTQSKFTGMAPQADLLFVKGIRSATSTGGFTDADVTSGVAWMMDKARLAGKPIAVNLSLGSQFGPHDGTSLQELFLDRLAGPGRVIVAAAGNSGGANIHCSYPVEGSDYQNALETGVFMATTTALLDFWAPAGTNISVGIAAYSPSNMNSPLFVTTAAAPGQLVQQTAISGATRLGDVVIDARTTADPDNGARNVLIQISPSTGGFDPSSIFWSVYTFGSGTFDMWFVTSGLFFPPSGPSVPSWFRGADDNKTIGSPASGKRILCVGSHVSKTSWVDQNGTTEVESGAVLDAISGFSSRGPSRDGRTLPNFTAPGEAIASALSKDFPADPTQRTLESGYQIERGTSQASPHITGIAALMLQRDPALTPENVRSILQQTATATGGNPNNVFGSGRVNALAALQATPDPLGCVVPLANGQLVPCDEVERLPMSLMAYPNPTPGQMRLAFTAPARTRVDLALYDIAGRRVRTLLRQELAPGAYSPEWKGDDDRGRLLPSGVYFARLISDSGMRTIRLLLRR
jgi:subtilisin family serine protease